MTWTVLEGTYKDGQVLLNEKLNLLEPLKVLVLIPNSTKHTKPTRSWDRLRQQIASEMSDLQATNELDRQQEFEKLSAKIEQSMPYSSLEEFENAMRGNEHDLARY